LISESGGGYFSEQGGGIIAESGGGMPRNLHRDFRRAPLVLDAEALLTPVGKRQIVHAGAGKVDQPLAYWPQPSSAAL
jgi:hypothetical protein